MNTGKLQQTERGTVSDPHEELGKDWTENYCRLIVTLPQEAPASSRTGLLSPTWKVSSRTGVVGPEIHFVDGTIITFTESYLWV